MDGYFRPLRRKLGIVTLGLVCVISVEWIRGFVVEDVWQPATGTLVDEVHKFHDDRIEHEFSSSRYGVTWQRLEALYEGQWGHFRWKPGWRVNPVSLVPPREEAVQKANVGHIQWRWCFCGFDFYDSEFDDYRCSFRRIPHWSIATSLTLISAWLLFSKPKAKRPPAEPVV